MKTADSETPITKVDMEKDLGVIIDNSLNFTDHINSKVSKANQLLGLIFKTFTYMDKEMFLNLYKSLVRPQLEYATSIWFPLYKKDTISIENVQRRATKLVTALRDLNYSERLKALGLPSLEYRRDRADMVQVYKILNDIDLIDKNRLFTLATYTATRGHSFKLLKKRTRLKLRSNYFSNRIVQMWNDLPDQVVMAPSLNIFKSRLNSSWHGHPYKFNPWCYTPGVRTRIEYRHQDASTEVTEPNQTSTM